MPFCIALDAGGKVYGTYDEAAVRKIIYAGRVRADSYLCDEGGAWIRLGESPRFAALLQAPPACPELLEGSRVAMPPMVITHRWSSARRVTR